MAATPHEQPKDWPSEIDYLTTPTYSAHVTPLQKRSLNTPTQQTASWPKIGADVLSAPYRGVRTAQINTPTHPAYRQQGLFATRHLDPGTFILPYLGRIHTNDAADTDAESNYDLSLDRELGLSIDANAQGNEARFMNDYRRVAEGPNAEFRDCWVQVRAEDGEARARWERWVGVFVLGAGKAGKKARGIRKGEEVVVNYGRGFWTERRRGVRGEET